MRPVSEVFAGRLGHGQYRIKGGGMSQRCTRLPSVIHLGTDERGNASQVCCGEDDSLGQAMERQR